MFKKLQIIVTITHNNTIVNIIYVNFQHVSVIFSKDGTD